MTVGYVLRVLLYMVFSAISQMVFFSTLCGAGVNEAKFLIGFVVLVPVPMRLLYNPTEKDKAIYSALLLFSFIWIPIFVGFLQVFV